MTGQEKGEGNTLNTIDMLKIQSNLVMWSPLLGSHVITSVGQSPFSCIVIENFISIEPLLRCHLCYKTKGVLFIHVWKLSRTKFISISQWFITLSLTTAYTGKGMGDGHIIMFINKYTVKQERNIYGQSNLH
jgi:hypothetical protein